jgi:uncharacterized protein (DUF2062 family)
VFRRRQPLTFLRSLRGFLWPRTGWRRAFVYYLKRLTRLSGTPHNIAAGFACGVMISFTPFVGFHILLGCLLALIVRGNFLAVAVGTLVGNPWTFPFIWLGGYELGKFLLGPDLAGAQPMPWRIQDLAGYVGAAAVQATTDGSVAMLKRLAGDLSAIAKPVLVGGIPLGIAAGLLTYFPLVRAITVYQEARRRRREQRRGEQRRRRDGAGGRLKAAGAPTDAETV